MSSDGLLQRSGNGAGAGDTRMKRIIIILTAITLILAGLIVLPMPLPFGAIMVLTGFGMLVSSSQTAARAVMAMRARSARLNRLLSLSEKYLPGAMGRALQRTKPGGGTHGAAGNPLDP